MTDRILDIAGEPRRLCIRDRQLVLQGEDTDVDAPTVPLEDIAVVVVSQRRVTYTQAVLSGLAECGAVLVVCDERSLPAGMLIPFQGHSLAGQRLREQIAVSRPLQKRLWQQVVRAKVRMQASVLHVTYKDDAGLDALADRVRSGDPTNVEAQAARKYWPLLFRDATFRRDTDSGDSLNGLLNYGYSVLRAIAARAVVGAGLNVTLGLHHHNRSNAFCLADDLMEPFRPLVDREVVCMAGDFGPSMSVNRETKGRVLRPLLGRVCYEGERRTLFDVFVRLAAALAGIYAGERADELLRLPQSVNDFAG